MGNTEKKLWRIEETDEGFEFYGDCIAHDCLNFTDLGIVEATEEEINELLDKPWNKKKKFSYCPDEVRPFEATEIKVTHNISEMLALIDERKECNRLCGYGIGN